MRVNRDGLAPGFHEQAGNAGEFLLIAGDQARPARPARTSKQSRNVRFSGQIDMSASMVFSKGDLQVHGIWVCFCFRVPVFVPADRVVLSQSARHSHTQDFFQVLIAPQSSMGIACIPR